MTQTEYLPGLRDLPPVIRSNHLYYGDNLTIMRNLPPACIDLIYLDPPFNSQRNYNLIYRKLTGQPVPEQEEAFCDAWELDPEKEEMVRRMPIVFREYGADEGLIEFWRAWLGALRNTQPRLLAYLIYMFYRLFEMRRVLKPTGSLYLHCDPHASHYIKVIMDGVFGHQNFRNEISWKRTFAHGSSRRYGPIHDTLLFYSKTDQYVWTDPKGKHTDEYLARHFRQTEEETGRRFQPISLTGAGVRNGESGLPWRGIDPTSVGRHWALPRAILSRIGIEGGTTQEKLDALDESGMIYWPGKEGGTPRLKHYSDELDGMALADIWVDIPPISAQAQERLGYPTQKPIILLQRIIEASSRPGDVVFDPFCGCGTAIYAAHLLGRKWIGCDIAILSVKITRDVLFKRYGLKEGEHYQISGVPLSVEGAQDLFERDPYQFQHWAVELSGGFASVKRSGDRGIDGRIHFETKDGLQNMVLSVKGGSNLTPAFMRELRGTLEREPNSVLGGLICLSEPTKGMRDEEARGGIWEYLGRPYHRLQIRTVEELLAGKAFDTPSRVQTLDWTRQVPLPF